MPSHERFNHKAPRAVKRAGCVEKAGPVSECDNSDAMWLQSVENFGVTSAKGFLNAGRKSTVNGSPGNVIFL
jgi:hypothetical protein